MALGTSYPVFQNDTLHVEVSQSTLILSDTTQGWMFTTPVPSKKVAFSSAEWIAEGQPTLPLADFGSVDFSNAAASGNGVVDGPIDSTAWSTDEITMDSRRGGPHGTIRATPSPLSGGNAFSVAWAHA